MSGINNHTSDDPYSVLGVSRGASDSEIRAAYRKLALRHHPDKQTTEQAKRTATTKFAEISHAYELLSDADQRRTYDTQQQQQGMWNNHTQHDDVFFHDPFQVFAQVFGQEFGQPQYNARPSQQSYRRDSFGMMQDPFFGSSMFGGDPFFGGSMFGRGGGGDVFSDMRRSMDQMRQQQHDMFQGMQQQSQGSNNNNNQRYFSSYSSSSTSSSIGPSGMRETTTTTTRNVNGKQQTVTERVVTKPDGAVERHVETTGDDDFPQLVGTQNGEDDVFGRQHRMLQSPGHVRNLNDNATRREAHDEANQPRRKWPRTFRSKHSNKKENHDTSKEKKTGDDHDPDGNLPPHSRY